MNKEPITVHYESIGSTNDKAKEIVLGSYTTACDGSVYYGDVLPILVTADAQTNGRGRYGKVFYSPSGSGIYMSYAYERRYSEEELLGVTTEVAELILPVLQSHTEDGLHIKPINDILKGDKKLAGILTERVDYPDNSGRYFIIVGIGINCEKIDIPEDLLDTEGNRLADIIGFLEPDCDHKQLVEELLEALTKLH
ncbi:MAG: biotin--[acetyl-CoA-carboxylase] ligase [Clostridiales bacterium]|nr:biotin--[acetyl-CoA-carboxylase] ligase [Candidatus Crickella caballi]